MKKLLLVLVIFLSGCTTAGPFVTNISVDNKQMKIEKAKVVYNMLFGIIGTKYKTTETINLGG